MGWLIEIFHGALLGFGLAIGFSVWNIIVRLVRGLPLWQAPSAP